MTCPSTTPSSSIELGPPPASSPLSGSYCHETALSLHATPLPLRLLHAPRRISRALRNQRPAVYGSDCTSGMGVPKGELAIEAWARLESTACVSNDVRAYHKSTGSGASKAMGVAGRRGHTHRQVEETYARCPNLYHISSPIHRPRALPRYPQP